jgi:hypothetical protein
MISANCRVKYWIRDDPGSEESAFEQRQAQRRREEWAERHGRQNDIGHRRGLVNEGDCVGIHRACQPLVAVNARN